MSSIEEQVFVGEHSVSLEAIYRQMWIIAEYFMLNSESLEANVPEWIRFSKPTEIDWIISARITTVDLVISICID